MQKAFVFGMFRALVVDNQDKQKFGRVLVWIPDVMPTVERTKGIWARPANNPLGGRNTEDSSDNHFMGTSYIPQKGSWVFIFFEGGNINRPYYFGALDLENTKVLPENQVGKNYQDKWTVIKSGSGRTVVVSDDPDDERVEITGKKRQMKDPPSGDLESVYKIDENMTTILFDERDGQEKILIRTHKGDFFHINIEKQNLEAYFENDIIIKCNNDLKITANGNIDVKSLAGDIKIQADNGTMDIKAANDLKQQSGGSLTSKAQNNSFLEAGNNINQMAGSNVNIDAGSMVNEQSGAATAGTAASAAIEADPKGERNQ